MGIQGSLIWENIFKKRNSKLDPVIEVLRENVLFETLNERELLHVASLVHVRNYEVGEVVFKVDDRGFGMFMIASGKVAIAAASSGKEVVVATLGNGSFFGELALIQADSIRSASAVARERSVLIGFFKPDLMDLIGRRPATGAKILFQLSRVLGERLLATTEKVAGCHENAA